MSARKKTRQNAGEGYGYMFHGAFKEKKDAVAKERKTKDAWIKPTLTNRGYRYIVMSPRTNPIKRKNKNAPRVELYKLVSQTGRGIRRATKVIFPDGREVKFLDKLGKREAIRQAEQQIGRNPHELLIMGANPSELRHNYFSEKIEQGSRSAVISANDESGPFSIRLYFDYGNVAGYQMKKAKTLAGARKIAAQMLRAHMQQNPEHHEHLGNREITVPPGSTITLRMNPTEVNPIAFGNPDRYTAARAIASGARYTPPALIQTKRQKRVAGMVRSARKHKYEWIPSEGIAPGQNPGLSTLLDVASIGTSLPALAKKSRRKNVELGTYENGVFHPWTRRPKSRQKKAIRRQNPSAEVIREEFTGAPVEHEFTRQEPHMPAGDYAQLGKLLSLYVKPRAGGQVLEIKGDGRTLLVSDESARQLWFVGGDQDVTDSLAQFGALERGANLFELGEARRIDYEQRKEHVAHPDQDHWRHNFGEETNERPKVLFDRAHKRLLLEGGAYEIRREGIVN